VSASYQFWTSDPLTVSQFESLTLKQTASWESPDHKPSRSFFNWAIKRAPFSRDCLYDIYISQLYHCSNSWAQQKQDIPRYAEQKQEHTTSVETWKALET
jgi:hypothetical protein